MEVLKPSIPCLLLFVLFTYSDIFIGKTVGEGVTPDEAKQLRDEVRGMFYHAFNGYMEHAFPRDELRPLSCEGEDTLGGYALTLIDSLDMLALLGDRERFASSVEWIGKNLRFDINKTVSVFETTIRILGGLLSAHLIASDYATGMKFPSYDDQLLHLSEDLARRLLPAFDTPTGIPFGSVNLLHGVDEHESKITSTAGGGTLTLEFGVLSRLTNDPIFEEVTKKAVRGLWARRSKLNLVGAHIDVFSGEWTQKDAGIGTSIDSFYEYLLKAYLLFGDEEYLFIFQEAYGAAMQYLHTDPWYVEVNMDSAAIVWPLFNSLQAFWPGLQVLAGDIDPAIRTHTAFFSVWKRYGFTPEGFNLATLSVQHGQKSYPLRPELMESTYWLYKATRDPRYLDAGRDMVASLQYGAQCPCGYCHISDVEFHSQEDHMESFFLAETVKYLWLLFDLAAGPDNLVENGPYKYIFSTEGHLLPTTPQISLVREHCSYFGAYCKNGNLSWESLTSDTSTDSQEINGSKFFKSWSSTSYPSDDPFHESTSGMIKGFCPGLSHGQKFGISYRASADTSHEDKSPSQSETSVVHSSSVVVISNPKAEDLPSDRIHDKVEELSEEGSEREPHQVQSSLVVVISNPKTEDLLSDRIHDKVEELNEEDSEGEPHQVQSNSVVIISNPKAEDLQSDRVHDKVEELSEEGSESEPHQVQSSSMVVISNPKAEDLQSDRVHDKVEELSEEGSESEPHQVSGRPIG